MESSDSEMDLMRRSLSQIASSPSLRDTKVLTKSRSGSKATMWEEIEMLYKDMEQREKDYQIAVEIGKMLLDKNKELQDQVDDTKTQYTLWLQERENELSSVIEEHDELVTKNDDLKVQVKQLQMQNSLLQSGRGDSEVKALLLSEEFYKMESKLEKYKKEVKEEKSKYSALNEELEKCKAELDQAKNAESELRKRAVTQRIKNNIQEEKEKAAVEVGDESKERERLEQEMMHLLHSKNKLEAQVKELTNENLYLKQNVTQQNDERDHLERLIGSLSEANQSLQRQSMEERELLQAKVKAISNLEEQIEQQTMTSLMNDSLDAELKQLDAFSNPPSRDVTPIRGGSQTQFTFSPGQQEDQQKRISKTTSTAEISSSSVQFAAETERPSTAERKAALSQPRPRSPSRSSLSSSLSVSGDESGRGLTRAERSASVSGVQRNSSYVSTTSSKDRDNARKYATMNFRQMKQLAQSGDESEVLLSSGEKTPQELAGEALFPESTTPLMRLSRIKTLSNSEDINRANRSLSDSVAEPEDADEKAEMEQKSREWKDKLSGLRKMAEEIRQREQKIGEGVTIGPDDKDWVLQELKKFRASRAEEHSFINLVVALRERLYDAELKNLTRTMRTVTTFADIVEESNVLIDSVLKELEKKVDKKVENDNIKIISEVLIENCKLRKIANDYSEAINQGTLDKLEKFKKHWPTQGRLEAAAKAQPKKHRLWGNFPLFDFFTGWFVEEEDPNSPKMGSPHRM
eukprot:TRINITY_DN1977_c0_g3_i1.p1 TRINITY_DN1977_c0_g3~~TRINITY_DN1977_c0_g3_i1.p1  ORF type:complete len:748 (+),score=244.89 TRINITY_DN1977_c0_g3_i1:240-2483(+)